MKKIYLTVDDHLTEINTLEKGCWVHLQNPTREEIEGLNARFALDPTYLQAALDEEESARIERDGDQTLIIVDIPYVEAEDNGYSYSTIPMGIVMVDDVIITVSTRVTPLISDCLKPGAPYLVYYSARSRLLLSLLALDAPDARARVGAAGRQRVIERWTWQRCAEQTVEQYREVLAMPDNVAKLQRNGRL